MASNGYVMLTPRVTPQLAAQLRRLAQREGTSVNHEVNVALRAHVDADKQRRKGEQGK